MPIVWIHKEKSKDSLRATSSERRERRDGLCIAVFRSDAKTSEIIPLLIKVFIHNYVNNSKVITRDHLGKAISNRGQMGCCWQITTVLNWVKEDSNCSIHVLIVLIYTVLMHQKQNTNRHSQNNALVLLIMARRTIICFDANVLSCLFASFMQLFTTWSITTIDPLH